MPDNDDWLNDLIDLDAVAPPKGTKRRKAKSRRVYTDGASLAPKYPANYHTQGPDQQRRVREVCGQFIPTDELVNVSLTHAQRDALLNVLDNYEVAETDDEQAVLDRIAYILRSTQ